MRKSKYALMLVCLVLCVGIVAYAANAQTPVSAKQLLLEKLQSTDFGAGSDLAQTASGKASYRITAISGDLVSSIEPFIKLTGTELVLDYKINSPQKKLEANYNLALDKDNYKGSMFLDNDKVIFSTEILPFIKKFDPSLDFGERGIPQYAYIADKNMARSWDNAIKGQYFPPEIKDLLIFVFEAVPDKYFTISLVNQKVSFSIDQKGFEDTLLSVLQKIKNDRERFAALVAGCAVALDSTQNYDHIKFEIMDSLEESISRGDYPDSLDQIQKILTGAFVLEELKYEASLLPSGQNSLLMAANFGGDSELKGIVNLKADFTDSKDNLTGTYTLDLTARENEEKIRVDGQISGEFKQTSSDATSSGLIKANATDFSGNTTLLNFELKSNSDSKADRNVKINTPVLTESNSINLGETFNDNPFNDNLKILVDGKRLNFDVEPCIQNGRTMVPIRQLAETLGCAVEWVEPDQININRGDTSIVMYIDRQAYTVNGVEKLLDAPPFIMDGKRTMVPLRFIAEELGCKVEYDAATKTVFIFSEKAGL